MFYKFNPMQTKTILLNDIDYITRNDKPVIRLFGTDPESNQNIIAYDNSFVPYMYVLAYDLDECLNQLRELGLDNLELENKIDIGIEKEFIKIILKHPQEVPKIRDSIRDLSEVKEIREYDIPFYRRYLIDKQITPRNIIKLNGHIIERDIYGDINIDENVLLFKMEEEPVMAAPDIDKLQQEQQNFIIEQEKPVKLVSVAQKHTALDDLTLDDITATPQEKTREDIIAEAEAAAFAEG